MDETLTSVNAEQAGAESLQTEPAPATEVATGESVSAVPAEQPTTEVQQPVTEKAEPKKQTQEENAQFKALRLEEKRRAEQTAIDAEYEHLASKSGIVGLDGKPIKTKADFETWQAHSAKFDELVNQGKSEAEAKLEIELESLRKKDSERTAAAEKAAQTIRATQEFKETFKKINGRDYSQESDTLPDEFWERVANGESYKHAYLECFAEQQVQKIKSVETGKKTAEANAANAAAATGSVTGNGAADNSVLTEEIINGMTDKQRMARWGDIKRFYNMK